MINAIKRFFGFHDSFGLRHSLEKLQSIQREIAFYPIREQANYADAITIENVNNRDFLEEQVLNIDENDTSLYTNLNATAVGNLAYIAAYNSNNVSARRKAGLILLNYKEYLNQFIN